MIKEVFATDETLALAKKKACEMLGFEEKFVDFEVMQFPEKKRLGFFGGKMAQVKATIRTTPAKKAIEFLKEIFYYMGLEDMEIEVTNEKSEICDLKIIGSNVKFVVGYHGETLDSLQYLAGFVANNIDKKNFCKIRLEAGDYRENRKRVLENLGRRMAYKVLNLQQRLTLEPMRSYERKIIHEVIQAIPDVYSWSEGLDSFRHVVISPTKKDYSNEKLPMFRQEEYAIAENEN
ncbi:Jag protein [Clostridia bacterium]|nr:Jag protein [Clostridia bacterium]